MWEERYIWLSYCKVWQFNFAGFFDIFRITKCGKVIVLQSGTDCYYKVHQVLQSVTDCYYKVCQVLQSMTVVTRRDLTRVAVGVFIEWICAPEMLILE